MNNTINLFTETLSQKEFDKYLNHILNRVKNKLQIKAKEYIRNNDTMHNFNKASIKKQIIREEALNGMKLKHEISIDDIINDLKLNILPNRCTVDEKFGDRLNYNILEEISILHRINKNEKNRRNN